MTDYSNFLGGNTHYGVSRRERELSELRDLYSFDYEDNGNRLYGELPDEDLPLLDSNRRELTDIFEQK